MKAAPADQRRLLDIAELDAEIGRLTHRAKSLPELEQLVALKSDFQQAADDVIQSKTALGDAEAALARVEEDLNPARARLERNQARVDDGSGLDQRSLSSMIEEIEHLKTRIATLEDADLAAMQAVEDAHAAVNAAEERKSEIQTRGREMTKARDEKLAELKTEAADVMRRRQSIAQQVAPELLALYDKLRDRLGSGVGRLDRSRCTGCGLDIDPIAVQRYQQAPADEVVRCDVCDRILVRA